MDKLPQPIATPIARRRIQYSWMEMYSLRSAAEQYTITEAQYLGPVLYVVALSRTTRSSTLFPGPSFHTLREIGMSTWVRRLLCSTVNLADSELGIPVSGSPEPIDARSDSPILPQATTDSNSVIPDRKLQEAIDATFGVPSIEAEADRKTTGYPNRRGTASATSLKGKNLRAEDKLESKDIPGIGDVSESEDVFEDDDISKSEDAPKREDVTEGGTNEGYIDDNKSPSQRTPAGIDGNCEHRKEYPENSTPAGEGRSEDDTPSLPALFATKGKHGIPRHDQYTQGTEPDCLASPKQFGPSEDEWRGLKHMNSNRPNVVDRLVGSRRPGYLEEHLVAREELGQLKVQMRHTPNRVVSSLETSTMETASIISSATPQYAMSAQPTERPNEEREFQPDHNHGSEEVYSTQVTEGEFDRKFCFPSEQIPSTTNTTIHLCRSTCMNVEAAHPPFEDAHLYIASESGTPEPTNSELLKFLQDSASSNSRRSTLSTFENSPKAGRSTVPYHSKGIPVPASVPNYSRGVTTPQNEAPQYEHETVKEAPEVVLPPHRRGLAPPPPHLRCLVTPSQLLYSELSQHLTPTSIPSPPNCENIRPNSAETMNKSENCQDQQKTSHTQPSNSPESLLAQKCTERDHLEEMCFKLQDTIERVQEHRRIYLSADGKIAWTLEKGIEELKARQKKKEEKEKMNEKEDEKEIDEIKSNFDKKCQEVGLPSTDETKAQPSKGTGRKRKHRGPATYEDPKSAATVKALSQYTTQTPEDPPADLVTSFFRLLKQSEKDTIGIERDRKKGAAYEDQLRERLWQAQCKFFDMEEEVKALEAGIAEGGMGGDDLEEKSDGSASCQNFVRAEEQLHWQDDEDGEGDDDPGIGSGALTRPNAEKSAEEKKKGKGKAKAGGKDKGKAKEDIIFLRGIKSQQREKMRLGYMMGVDS